MITHSFHISILVRVLISLCTRTFFQPDEYFQSIEPAHHLVFGYGHLTWEWTSEMPIRSILYPLLNVPVYYVLKALGVDSAGRMGDWFLLYGPKLVHGFLAALTDIWICELTRVVLGSAYVSTALFLSLTSFFNALALSRSLSNSSETSLCTIAFAYYPWDASAKLSSHVMFNRVRWTIMFSALACMVRPTNAVIWIFLYAKLFWSLRHHQKFLVALFVDIIITSTLSLLTLFAIDTVYYHKPTFTPLNFLLANLSSVSLFYGVSGWSYYLVQALPILCTTALPFTLYGMYLTLTESRNTALRTMLGTVAWSVGVYSLAGHKEWRFLHPILPLLYVFAAKSLVDRSPLRTKPSKPTTIESWASAVQETFVPPICRSYRNFLLITVPASVYVVLFYCSAPVTVMAFIRSIPREDLQKGGIGFLMPCHSTPGHAYLHRPELVGGRMWSLGCEPPLEKQDLKIYQDQTDVFYNSPINYLRTYFPPRVDPTFPISPYPVSLPGTIAPTLVGEKYPWRHEWPLYIVFFGDLLQEKGVQEFLEAKGYYEMWKRGREWEGEGKRKGGVRVWKWTEEALL
ncbi:glycosyltransferase family 22 protein [Cyathus striatus]|nr:glycosyltransferase family 22 protein [Cyathus striatus]